MRQEWRERVHYPSSVEHVQVLSLVKRHAGGEACLFYALCVYIYAKYDCPWSIRSHCKFCPAANITCNSEHIVMWNVPVCKCQCILCWSWEGVWIGGGITDFISAIDAFHWWGQRGQRWRELPTWRLLRVQKTGLGPYLTFELLPKFLNIYSLDSGCDLKNKL